MNKKNEGIKIIGGVIGGALLMYGAIYFFPQQFSEVITKTEKDVTVVDNGIADAVEKVYDAVVVVTTYNGDQPISSGTGFVYESGEEKAKILTNSHVIEGGNKVTVTFTDGSVVETDIIGSNEYEDVAVLEIESSHVISVAEIGSSNDIRVGDTSFAVGAPLDDAFSWSVTRGIISGTDRLVEVSVGDSQNADYVMVVLQTDTAINSGNSGGPLCNSNGEVIGINTLKLGSDGVEGMGFAIPIEEAIETAEEIINGKSNSQPYLGVGMIDFSAAYYYPEYNSLIEESNLDGGVIITEITKNSAAENAGLQAGDIITMVNSEEVKTIAYFRYALYQHDAGDEIEITYYRDGKTNTVKVTLGTNQLTS